MKDDFMTVELKKGESQAKNVTIETMMYSKPVKIWT